MLTCPLDVFAGERFGALEWRGIIVRSFHVPHVEYAQGAMVVNYPGLRVPVHPDPRDQARLRPEVRGNGAGRRVHERADALLPDRDEENRALNTQYQNFLRSEIGEDRTFFAGRLANYVYIDMDDCMRQALDAAEDVLAAAGVRL